MPNPRPSILAVFSAKGGVGKSLVATNLAAAFAGLHHLPTAVIDLTPGLGQDDLLLDLAAERSWADLLPVIRELGPRHLELASVEHPSGLRLLAAPSTMEAGVALRPEMLPPLVEAFRRAFVVTVFDCPTGLEAINRAVYELADLRLVIATPDLPALRSTQRMLTGAPDGQGKTVLVLNQYSRGVPLRPSDAAENLKLPLAAVIPTDPRTIWENVSYGQPCALSRKRGFGGEIRSLSVRLLRGLVPVTPEEARASPRRAAA